ncbi:MAG: hypothetical protein ACR2O3_15980 [Rhizobiaceae bacterium]
MNLVKAHPLPENALLSTYTASSDHYTDCFIVEVNGQFSLPEFVCAFYTTWLFRLERVILKWVVNKPSTDEDAIQVATGDIDRFAAWTTEARTSNQLLMCAMGNRTRSWFMVEKAEPGRTRLYFGSAVIPEKSSTPENPKLGFAFTLLLGFHNLYSRALLGTARRKLVQ